MNLNHEEMKMPRKSYTAEQIIAKLRQIDLNSLSVLNENYSYFNIVSGGLRPRTRLKATRNRDYLLVPKTRIESDELDQYTVSQQAVD